MLDITNLCTSVHLSPYCIYISETVDTFTFPTLLVSFHHYDKCSGITNFTYSLDYLSTYCIYISEKVKPIIRFCHYDNYSDITNFTHIADQLSTCIYINCETSTTFTSYILLVIHSTIMNYLDITNLHILNYLPMYWETMATFTLHFHLVRHPLHYYHRYSDITNFTCTSYCLSMYCIYIMGTMANSTSSIVLVSNSTSPPCYSDQPY